jgi:hypothetical protein
MAEADFDGAADARSADGAEARCGEGAEARRGEGAEARRGEGGHTQTGAYDACLRRSHVVATLAARIDGLLQRPSDRIASLLRLPSDQLIGALVPSDRLAHVVRDVEASSLLMRERQPPMRSSRFYARIRASTPDSLRGLPDAPPVLWVKGGSDRLAALLDGPGVPVVGGGRPSA